MNFYDIIEPFAAKSKKGSSSSSSAKSTSSTTATPAATTRSTPSTPAATTTTAKSTPSTPVATATTAKSTATPAKSRSIPEKSKTTTPARRSATTPDKTTYSSFASGLEDLAVLATPVLMENMDDIIDTDNTDNDKSGNSGRRSYMDGGRGAPQLASSQYEIIQEGKRKCDRVQEEDRVLEFRKPYLFMLKPPDDIMKNNEYNYRLISNIFLNENNLKEENKRYLYIFGLFPCKYIPSAYIPLNRKKLFENFNRLKQTTSNIEELFGQKKKFETKLQDIIRQFANKISIYNNLNLTLFGIILIFFWALVLLFINYVVLYYLGSSFNNILAFILFVLLLFSIIWKMIYTVQN